MTIDEAIYHAEKVVKQQMQRIDNLSDIPMFGGSDEDIKLIEKCEECAEQHRQLAEWLKDYKRLKEKEESKRPIINRGFVLCPSCDICIRYPIADKYTRCPYCGQALKWGDEE